MRRLLRLQRRTEQPQDGSRLDPGNPLAGRFAVALLPAVTQANLGFGAAGSINGHALSRVAMPAGLATRHSGSGGAVSSSRLFGPTPSYPTTMILVCRQTSTANTRLMEAHGASGAISGSTFYIAGGSSTTVTYALRNNFSTTWTISATVPTPPDGNLSPALNNDLVIVAQSLSATDHRLCVNGSAVSTGSTSTGSMVAWDRIVLGIASGTADIAGAFFASGGVGLTDDQMQAFSRDVREVWALFEPERWGTAVASAGGGGYSLQVTPGSYSINGQSVGLLASRLLQAQQGTYDITGNGTVLTKGVVLSVTPGTYAVTGSDVVLSASKLLTANPGAYSITGTDVQLTYTAVGSYSLAVTPGSYAINGNTVGLSASRQLAVTAGSYAITGSSVTLTYGVIHTLTVTPGSYSVTGYSATLGRTALLGVTAGAYAYTGRSVVLTYSGLADGVLDAVYLFSRVTPNVQLLASLAQSVRLSSQLPESAALGSSIP